MQTFLRFWWTTVLAGFFCVGTFLFFPQEAFGAKCSDGCTAGKTCTCLGDGKSCSGTVRSGTFDDCSATDGYTCCETSSSGSCDKANCKTSPCASGQTSDATCKASVCSSAEYYCISSSSSSTGGSGTTLASISFPPPLKYTTVQEVLMSLLHALQGVIVVLSLVFIVIGAVFYITSAGNSSRVSMAKLAITASLIGLSIGILAPTFLKEIASVLGWGGDIPPEVAAAPTAATILLAVLNFLLSIVGVLAIIMLVVGAIMFFGAAGSQDRITTGKKIITFSLVGIVVALASLVIVRQIAEFFAGG